MIALSFGMAAYTVNDTIVKFLARDMPFGEVIFLRGIFSVLVLFAAVAASGGLSHIAPAWTRPVLWRSACDALGTLCFIAALVHMKIAELSAVVLTAPLILTALAAFVFRDQVGWRRWSAIAVGLIGSLFIVKPDTTNFDVWALVALAAAVFSAGRDITTRQANPAIPSLVVGLYGAAAVMLSGAAVGLAERWVVPDVTQWLGLVFAGGFLGLGTWLIVLAFRDVEISAVAPFRYTLLIWGGLSGYFAFGEIPDGWSLFGAGLIALSGLYALHREAMRRRDLAARSVPPA